MAKTRPYVSTVNMQPGDWEMSSWLDNNMGDSPAFLRFLPQVRSRQSAAWRYGGAVLTSLAFIALRWLLGRVLDDGVPFAVLFIPIALSAFYGGLGPGLVSVLTTITLADYFLIPPLYTLGLSDTKAVVYTLLFSISGLIVSALGELGRNAALEASNEAEIQKVAQQQLLVNEERLRITEQVVSGGVWDWDIVTDTIYWSDGYRRLYDYPLDETPSREKWELSIHPADRDRIVAQLDELLRDKLHNWSLEHRILAASGRVRWIGSHGQVFYDSAGKPRRMVGFNLDITAHKFADDANRETEARLRIG